MNKLSQEWIATNKAVPPARVENPYYVVELPHRFGRFFGMIGDGFQTGQVALYGEWAREESLLLESMIKPGDWVLDCGANTGNFTLAFASRVGPTGRVFAFEPQLYPAHCLVANVITNSLSHFVAPMRVALGKECGEIEVPILNPKEVNNFGGCSLVDKEAHTGPLDLVPLMTIDSLELPACHLIKVDVEGMEPDVLQGAFETITKYQPILWVEQLDHREGSREDLLKIFDEHDYKAWKIQTTLYSPRNIRNSRLNPYILGDEPMHDDNVLAIHKDSKPPDFVETKDLCGSIREFK